MRIVRTVRSFRNPVLILPNKLPCFSTMNTVMEKSSSLSVANKESKAFGSPVKATDQPTALKRSRSEETSRFRVKKLTEHATLPVRGSAGAAGYDLAR